jgi:ribosomal protein L11 methyltransferase
MNRPRPLQVWSKNCQEHLEPLWLQRLAPFADRLAVLSHPNRKSLRLEIYGLSPGNAKKLTQEWGGRTRPQLPPPAPKAVAPIRIRQRLLIVPTESEPPPETTQGRALLRIPAGMAFGTGDHATTSTCLRLLADLELDGKEFLDLGCGTGILALAARKLGANRVLAADFDPDAVRVTKDNLRLNQLSRVTVRRLDVLDWKPDRQWPVVAANLFSGVLIEAAPTLAAATAPGGTLIFSGVLQTQAQAVCRAMTKNGFRIQTQVRRGKWFTALAVRA